MEKRYVDENQLIDLQTQINEIKEAMASIDSCYPVGSIYISVNGVNPKDIFGFGTWEQIQDRFLLAAGTTYTGGSTGGEATVTLSKTQVPAVSGTIQMHSAAVATNVHQANGCFSSGLTNEQYRAGGTAASGASSIGRIDFSNGGMGAAHNNMPPYLAVYVWKRTA